MTSLVAVKLFELALPVTLTEPNVVFPPEVVEVNDDQFAEFDSPSVGHTFNIAGDSVRSNQSWPANGFAGGAVLAKFSIRCTKLVSIL